MSQAIIRRSAVFVRELLDGKYKYVRQPYDHVEYDRSEDENKGPYKTYYQPFSGKQRTPGKGAVGNDDTTSTREVYDELLVLDRPDPNAPYKAK